MADMFEALGDQERRAPAFTGVVTGWVTSIRDPDRLGRVQLRLPWISDEFVTPWARIASPLTGPDAAVRFPPPVGSEVLVAFEHGNLRFPYVLGLLSDAPLPGPFTQPEDSDDGPPRRAGIQSSSGHRLIFDDTPRQERVEAWAGSGPGLVLGALDKPDGGSGVAITGTGQQHDRNTSSDAEGVVRIVVKEGGKGRIEISLSTATIVLEQERVTISGREIEIAAEGKLTLKGRSVDVSADQSVTVKGATIRLN